MPDEPAAQRDPAEVHWGRRAVATATLIAVLIGGLYLLGVTHPAKQSAITTDSLGPQNGSSVQRYLDDAAAGLDRVGAGPRWALISLRAPVDDDTAWSLMSGTRQSRVAVHVSIVGVATPAKYFAVTGNRPSLDIARANAITDIAANAPPSGADDESADRARRVSAVSIGRLRSGCACIIAMVVRGNGDRLRQIAASAQVRSVEVLPADAAGGRFALTALLPEQADKVEPLDDTGVVPSR